MTFQELAARVSHRDTGRVCAEPIAHELLKRVAANENLHMLFYRRLTEAALEIAPDQTMESICRILAFAVSAGSLFFSHVNDADFWLVNPYFGMTIGQTIKTWSLMETVLSVVGFVLLLGLVI